MRRMWTFWRTEVEEFEVEIEEQRAVGDNDVLTLARTRWRGPASGIVVESPLAMVATVRDVRVLRSMAYLSHADALEAVRLAE